MTGRHVQQPLSRRFALDGADLRKLGTGFLIALVGAVATFLSDAATSMDFGMWSPFVAMAVSVVVNAIRKWIADNSPAPENIPHSKRLPERRATGWTTEAVILALALLTLVLLGAAAFLGGDDPADRNGPDESEAVVVPAVDDDSIQRAFVLQRQLFARVCLEAARRERAGLITSEEAENAWCEPRWAAARAEAFGLLAESRDRQLAGGWIAESSAAGLEAWAMAADPALRSEAAGR